MNFTVNNPLISTKILSVTFYNFTVCLNHVSIHPFYLLNAFRRLQYIFI